MPSFGELKGGHNTGPKPAPWTQLKSYVFFLPKRVCSAT